jgi:hypothetical protein
MPDNKDRSVDVIQDYIGDGVYVEFDGYVITLKANDIHHPTDTIYLEPDVLAALNRFAQRMKDDRTDPA